MVSGFSFAIYLNIPKRKYYGCFNNIVSVVGKEIDKILLLHLTKTYCLPKLSCACEVWFLGVLGTHELNVLWNSAYRHVLTVAGVRMLDLFDTTIGVYDYLT